MGYISQSPFIFSGTVEDNLLYAHRAAHLPTDDKATTSQPPSLDQLILSLQQAGLFVDVIRFGLETVYEHSTPAVSDKIITMRKKFREDAAVSFDEYIEFYDATDFLHHSSILDNLTFSVSRNPGQTIPMLLDAAGFMDFLSEQGLKPLLLTLGNRIAEQSVEYYLAPQRNELSILLTPLSPRNALEYAPLVNRLHAASGYELSPDEERLLLKAALLYIPGQHTSIPMPPDLTRHILTARPHGQDLLRQEPIAGMSPLQHDTPVQGQSVFRNILFGTMKTDSGSANEKINQAIIRVLIEEDCLEDIAAAGMQYQVGNMGDKLSGGQKQKLAIARVLLKEPKILLMDEATSALDNASQARIQHLMDRWRGERTVIAVVHRLDSIQHFDAVGVMKAGKLVEYGPYEQLMEHKGVLYELVTGQKSVKTT